MTAKLPPEEKTRRATERYLKWAKENRGKVNEHTRAWRKKQRELYPEKVKAQKFKWRLRSQYGITPEQYEVMALTQGYACAICRSVPESLHIDHNHKTGAIRGLLCGNCNTGIGLLCENTDFLASAINYLTK